MIVKRIRQSTRQRRPSLRRIEAAVTALTTYAVDADPSLLEALARKNQKASYVLDVVDLGVEHGEKVEFHGTRNLIGTSLAQHQRQMLAACLLDADADDPLEHYVISWRQGEQPTRENIEEVVTIFCAEMGYEQSQIVWAVHSNTAHWHLHIVANRINLVDGKVVTPGDGWDIDRLHQVIALIEDRQGWSTERNAIYVAKHDVVYDKATSLVVRRADGSRDGCYKRRAVAPERGQSPEFRAILRALEEATSWRDLHHRLSQEDATYATKGSGAEIRIRDKRMPASDFGREFGFANMQARLGPFEDDIVRNRDPHEIYQAALREERARLREALNAVIRELHVRRKLALQRARALVRIEILKAIDEERIQLAFDRVGLSIKHEFDLVRRTIAAGYLNRERWYLAGQPMPQPVNLPEIIFAGEESRDHALAEEHGFIARPCDAGMELCDKTGKRVISDYGVILLVHQNEVAVVHVALSLASRRGNIITVSGSPAFIDLCRRVGRERGLHLVDDEGRALNPATNKERHRPRQTDGNAAAPKQVEASGGVTDRHKSGENAIEPEKSTAPELAASESEATGFDVWTAYKSGHGQGR